MARKSSNTLRSGKSDSVSQAQSSYDKPLNLTKYNFSPFSVA